MFVRESVHVCLVEGEGRKRSGGMCITVMNFKNAKITENIQSCDSLYCSCFLLYIIGIHIERNKQEYTQIKRN